MTSRCAGLTGGTPDAHVAVAEVQVLCRLCETSARPSLGSLRKKNAAVTQPSPSSGASRCWLLHEKSPFCRPRRSVDHVDRSTLSGPCVSSRGLGWSEDDNPLYLFETDMDDNAHIRWKWSHMGFQEGALHNQGPAPSKHTADSRISGLGGGSYEVPGRI